MAKAGYYNVWTDEPGWEVRRSQARRECWGVEVDLGDNNWLNTHAHLCNGWIGTGELYAMRFDRRSNSLASSVWCSCLYCIAQYQPDKLRSKSGLAEWLPIMQDDIDEAQRKLQRVVKELHNMGIRGGAWSI